MLTEEEQNNVRDLLEAVPTVDIMVVAYFLTSKTLRFDTREDAIKAILLHETSCASLLNRKKITKASLFKYLHSKQIAFDGSLDKASLCNLILDHWDKKAKSVVSSSIQNQENASSTIETNYQDNRKEQASTIENELAHQFCSWFYSRLNEDFTKSGGSVLTENDFWPDCEGSILLPETAEAVSQTFGSSGATETVSLLREFRSQYDLYFSPNLIHNGVKAKCDPHGLVLITASGTLHSRSGDCVGIFDQAFGLIADPMSQHNYKIKRVNLRLTTRTKAS